MSRFDGDMFVAGTFQATTLIPSAGSVADAHVAAGANIAYTKLQHEHRLHYGRDGAAASLTHPLHRCRGATGTVISIHAGSIVPATGDAAVTVNLMKNGVSILTGVITLNDTRAARVAVAGVLTGATALVVGDLLELVIVATPETGVLPTGLFVDVSVSETAQ